MKSKYKHVIHHKGSPRLDPTQKQAENDELGFWLVLGAVGIVLYLIIEYIHVILITLATLAALAVGCILAPYIGELTQNVTEMGKVKWRLMKAAYRDGSVKRKQKHNNVETQAVQDLADSPFALVKYVKSPDPEIEKDLSMIADLLRSNLEIVERMKMEVLKNASQLSARDLDGVLACLDKASIMTQSFVCNLSNRVP